MNTIYRVTKVKAEQILPKKLEQCVTQAVIFRQEKINFSEAVNSAYLSEDPNTGLRREQTVTAKLLRVALAYAVVVSWIILD